VGYARGVTVSLIRIFDSVDCKHDRNIRWCEL
jgi:hypothetical protein